MDVKRRPTRVCAYFVAAVAALGSTAVLSGAETGSADRAQQEGFAGPRELLDRLGIDVSRRAALVDGKPWRSSEDEVLLRLMARIPQIRLNWLERWASPIDPGKLKENPDGHRGDVYRMTGRAIRCEAVRLDPQVAARADLAQYYRVTLRLPGGDHVQVLARDVPEAWTRRRELDERASAMGFFLKLGPKRDGQPEPILAAPRVAWYPATLLGGLGMDVGLLDVVRQEEEAGGPEGASTATKVEISKLRLSSEDREAFYQMLAAVGRSKPGQLARVAREERRQSKGRDDTVVRLFNEPKAQLGRLELLAGTVRRILPVQIRDEDVVARVGFDQYYEVYLFPADSQSNPVVFCVRELPPGMPTGEGPQLSEHAEIAGFFFKTWAYRRAKSASGDEMQWQLAPLLIGREPGWLKAPRRDSGYGSLTAGLFLVVLAGLGVTVWLYGRSDRKSRQYLAGLAANRQAQSRDLDDLKPADGPDPGWFGGNAPEEGGRDVGRP